MNTTAGPLEINIEFAGWPLLQYPSRNPSLISRWCHIPIRIFENLLQCCPAILLNNLKARVSLNMPKDPSATAVPLPTSQIEGFPLPVGRVEKAPAVPFVDASALSDEEEGRPSRPGTPDSAYGDGNMHTGVITGASPSRSIYGLLQAQSGHRKEE